MPKVIFFSANNDFCSPTTDFLGIFLAKNDFLSTKKHLFVSQHRVLPRVSRSNWSLGCPIIRVIWLCTYGHFSHDCDILENMNQWWVTGAVKSIGESVKSSTLFETWISLFSDKNKINLFKKLVVTWLPFFGPRGRNHIIDPF